MYGTQKKLNPDRESDIFFKKKCKANLVTQLKINQWKQFNCRYLPNQVLNAGVHGQAKC